MKINSLYLDNIGNFEDFTIDFEKSRNAIFGQNGIGKTTILNSIATFFHHKGRGKAPLFYKKEFEDDISTLKLNIEYHHPSLGENSLFSKEDKKIVQELSNKDEQYKDKLKKLNKEMDGKIIYFTSNRFFSENHSTPKAEIKKDSWILQVYDQKSTSFNSPNEIHEYIIYNELGKGLHLLYKEDEKFIPDSSLKELINSAFHNKEFKEVRNQNGVFEIIFIDKENNNEFTLFDLSHGEKLLLTFIVEFHKNKWINSVIMIDEPEMSLHPDWQIKLIPLLQKLGENNQFIIATHSKEIIYTFDEDEVVYLG